jgi:DNA-binding PadR family transcriptional regulator
MAKTFPIRLTVEEVALGTVLRKLNEMPGIVTLDLDLGKGGEGPGKDKLTQEAIKNSETADQTVLKLLIQHGPLTTGAIKKALRWNGTRVYGAINVLKKKRLIETDSNKVHTALKVVQVEAVVPALPSPSKPKISHGPGGRASPGSGNIVLKSILSSGPKTPGEIRKLVAENGVSAKSISGVMERARKSGLIKRNGAGVYELTAKGQKIQLPEGATHG